jgi:NADH-quinone oxidoreductase subunit J
MIDIIMNVSILDIVFYAFALLIVASAFIVVFSKNVMHSAFALMFTLLGVAAFYVLLNADFIAITQIMVYIGGIMILIVFGVMLTTKITNIDMKSKNIQIMPAAVLTAIIGGALCGIFWNTNWSVAPTFDVDATASYIGLLLLTDYILPFEAVSVLLLIAMIGAALIARRKA